MSAPRTGGTSPPFYHNHARRSLLNFRRGFTIINNKFNKIIFTRPDPTVITMSEVNTNGGGLTRIKYLI